MSPTSVPSFLAWMILIIATSNLLIVTAYPDFPARIPNGVNVPHPCQPQNIWPGVGHLAIGGGGPRNPFGLDFAANGFTWTITLCQKDSDQDGFTNGKELGDPNCVWREGEEPENTIGISHPGVCEPVNSEHCTNLQPWLVCPANFSCPDFDLPTTKNMALHFPHMNTPAQETTYICMGFRLPTDEAYHIIGQTPIINNTHLMHHMLLLGCSEDLEEDLLREPFMCGLMGHAGCEALLGAWGPGVQGQCHAKEFGFPMGGQTGFKYAIVELHWNNPMLYPDQWDSSGMTIYYTNQLRPNDGKMLIVGQLELSLPPHMERVHSAALCPRICSEHLPQSVYITESSIHMHYLGRSGDLSIIRRDGQRVEIFNEPSYDYNSPRLFTLDKHIEFQPGDELVINCVFKTTDKNVTTEWGEDTSSEMCYSFTTVYPAIDHFDDCSEYGGHPFCSLYWDASYQDCDISVLESLIGQALIACNDGKICTPNCASLSKDIAATGCLNGSVAEYIATSWPNRNPVVGHLFDILDCCSTSTLPCPPLLPPMPGGGQGSAILQSSHLGNALALLLLIGSWKLHCF